MLIYIDRFNYYATSAVHKISSILQIKMRNFFCFYPNDKISFKISNQTRLLSGISNFFNVKIVDNVRNLQGVTVKS